MSNCWKSAVLCCVLLSNLGLSPSALADPTAAITVERPEDLGDPFIPGARPVDTLPQDIVEEEFFISGSATLYTYANNPPLAPTDTATAEEEVPYKTRVIVRRPARKNKFNGNVVIEWWNTSAGFDTAPSYDGSANYFAREGYIYIGLTNSNQGLSHLTGGCSLFGVTPPTCEGRYDTLSLPDDGLIWDVATQLASHLKTDPGGLLPQEYKVKRIYHTGQSQQAGSIITYASGFHDAAAGINDGYFIQANIGARRINSGPICDEPDSPAFPDCTPVLQNEDRLVRTDLPVPVVQAITETDLTELFGAGGRQSDAPNFRYYEMAGTAHLTVHKNIEVLPPGLAGPDPVMLEQFCQNTINSLADGPVHGSYLYNAMWHNLNLQVRKGVAPPPGAIIETGADGELMRDEFSNSLGGVRVPEMDVPTGSHYPAINQADPDLPGFLKTVGDLACRLGGSTTPFTADELHSLYDRSGDYVKNVKNTANTLKQDGFLLRQDRKLILQRAERKAAKYGL